MLKTDSKQFGKKEEITRDNIEGTPFTAIKQSNTGHFAVMGHYRLTEDFGTKYDLLEFIHRTNNWELILNVVSIMAEEIVKTTKSNK